MRHSPKGSAGTQTSVTAFLKGAVLRKSADAGIMFFPPKPDAETTDSGEEETRGKILDSMQDTEIRWKIAYAQTGKSASALETIKICAQDASKHIEALEAYCKESSVAAKYIKTTVEKLDDIMQNIHSAIAKESSVIIKGLTTMG